MKLELSLIPFGEVNVAMVDSSEQSKEAQAELAMSDLQNSSIAALINSARDGDTAAMGRLAAQFRPYLLLIANRELTPQDAVKDAASDIVQNTLISAVRCIDGFEGENEEELLAWLRGILLNDLKQARRRYATAKRGVDREQPLDHRVGGTLQRNDCSETPSAVAVAREESDRLRSIIERLPENERLVIRLRNWDRLPFAEIGERMGRSADAARKLWSRACVRLQKELESSKDDDRPTDSNRVGK